MKTLFAAKVLAFAAQGAGQLYACRCDCTGPKTLVVKIVAFGAMTCTDRFLYGKVVHEVFTF